MLQTNLTKKKKQVMIRGEPSTLMSSAKVIANNREHFKGNIMLRCLDWLTTKQGQQIKICYFYETMKL